MPEPSVKGNKGDPGAPGATGATGATGPAGAPNPDATTLGGIPASGFTQSNCGSLTGAVKGFAQILSSANFSSSFVGVQGYNCSGGPINARRIGIGDYEVQFNNGTALALGNVISPNPSTSSLIGSVSIVQLGEGDFQVLVWDPQTQAVEDLPFELMTP